MTEIRDASCSLTLSQLLAPELLSTNTLKTILRDRCIQVKNIDAMTRETLLSIVHRVAVPLPQRPRDGVTPDSVSELTTRLSVPKGNKTKDFINIERTKIKLKSDTIATANGFRNSEVQVKTTLKRPSSTEQSSEQEKEASLPKKSRVKITWP